MRRHPTGRSLSVLAAAFSACLLAANTGQTPPPPSKLEVVHTLKGHGELVHSVAFSPDGKLVATGSFDKTIKLWDAATGKEIRVMQGPSAHTNIVIQVAFSPSGRVLASCSTDNTIKLWDVPATGPLFKNTGPAGINDVKLSPDGTQLATADADGKARLWNAVTGKETTALSGHNGPVKCVAYNANGQWLASGGEDRSVRLWNVANGQSLGVIALAHTAPVQAVAFHPNNQMLISADASGNVRFWTLPLKADVPLAPAPTGALKAMAVSPDGKFVVIGGDDQTVRVWEVSKPGQGRALTGPKAAVNAVGTNGTLIAAAYTDHTVCVWNLASGELLAQISAHRFPITSVALDAKGQNLLTSSLDGSVKVWPLPIEGKPPQSIAAKMILTTHERGTTGVVFHPNGTQFYTSGVEGTIKLWDLPAGNLVKAFTDAKDAVLALTLSREANPMRIAAACKDRTVRVWTLADGKLIATIPQPEEVHGLSFSPDGTKLVTGNVKGEATVWTLADYQPLQQFSTAPQLKAVAFVDNQTIAVSGSDNAVSLRKIDAVRVAAAHKQAITDMALTPNGSHVLTASLDGTVNMTNTTNGKTERTFKGHSGAVKSVVVNRAGTAVITGGEDKTVRAFSLADAKEIKAIALPSPVQRVAVSPGQGLIVAGCAGNEVVALNGAFIPGQPLPADFGKVLATEKQTGPVLGVACHPDNATYTAGGADKNLTTFKITVEGPIRNIPGHANLVDNIAFTQDGTQIASCSHDGTVRFWNLSNGQQAAALNFGQPPQPAYCLALSNDGKHLVVGGLSKELRLYDVPGKKLLKECKAYEEKANPKGHQEAVTSVAFTNDGKYFLSAGFDGQIKVWNTADGSFVRQLNDPAIKHPDGKPAEKAHNDWIHSIRFTPDGSRLISVGNGGWLCIWNFAEGKPLFQQKFDTGLYSVAISPDGKLMALGCRDYSTLIVKVP
jgi:WD40 repeat protein